MDLENKGAEISARNEKYLRHLQGLVQIPSVSSVNDEHTDWSRFDELHQYLQTTYPMIYQKLELTVIGKASLLFRWPSENPDRKPVLLMAHQDVVPAGREEQWSHPPFAGEVEDGFLWGRGSEDCKSLLSAEMDAVEELLEEHFKPSFDIYLSFGHNEEVQCTPDKKGSILAAEYLKRNGVELACIFDEGGNIIDNESGVRAEVALAEKAPNEFVLYKDGNGGHASRPGKGTVLGDIARAAAAVEEHPMPYRLTPLVKAFLKAEARFKDKKTAKVYRHPGKHFKKLKKLAAKDRTLDAMLHTTFAVTMAEGSAQANVLPSHAEATMSVRILQGDTVESVKKYLESIISEGVLVKVPFAENPKRAGSTDSDVYELLCDTIHEVYGEKTAIVPKLMLGASDSRNYAEVSPAVFRFSGRVKTPKWGEAHQVDERMPVDKLYMPVDFFKTFLGNYNK